MFMSPLLSFFFVGLVAAISQASPWPSNVTGIIQGYGYPVENYEVQTPDGYILSMQRIPHGRTSVPAAPKAIVLFQHGLVDCSAGVTLNNPTEALPFILADNGYEVWLGNNRGNGYSMKHVKYTSKDPEFWDFTWDDMAAFDLPSQINFVLQRTGVKKLVYIGHSEGTIQAFSGFTINPNLANNVTIFIALAPVAYVYHLRSLVLQTLAKFDADEIFALLGVKEFSLPGFIQAFLPDVCKITPSLCVFTLDLLMGPSTETNKSRESYYLNYEPNPTSVRNMIHWAQGVRHNEFQMYDYGTAGNKKHYNQATPPLYDLTKFPKNLPLALFTGGNDYLADPKDVSTLLGKLPSPPRVQYEPTYAHMDFLWALNANTHIYPVILTLIENQLQMNTQESA